MVLYIFHRYICDLALSTVRPHTNELFQYRLEGFNTDVARFDFQGVFS
jgi:hypothetical protein